MKTFRQHQEDLFELATEMRQGRAVKEIWAHVVTGGGKSLLPQILASQLIGTRADRLCWLVPRDALRRQGAADFTDQDARLLLRHQLAIRESYGSEQNPARNTSGYITTYQSVQEWPSLHMQEFERCRYILVLDEPHHIPQGSDWARMVAPLIERAALTLYMTGVIDRGDGQRIHGLDYKPDPEHPGQWVPITDSTEDRPFIRYRRADALRENAIIQVRLAEADARARYVSSEGRIRDIERFADVEKHEARDAVWVALDPKYAYALLEQGVREWKASRITRPHNQLLVIAHDQDVAPEYVKFLREAQIRAGLAITDVGPAAQKVIQAFRTREIPALVTVGMAYEGLDAPGINHEVALTHIRSRPWIEQMVGRSVRVDPRAGVPASEQVAMIYAPHDPLMVEVMAQITAEQSLNAAGPVQPTTRCFGPQSTGSRGSAVVVLDVAQTDYFIRDLFRYGRTPREQEELLARRIEKRSRRIDAARGFPFGTTNGQIWSRFRKPREQMTLEELAQVWGFLNTRYGDIL